MKPGRHGEEGYFEVSVAAMLLLLCGLLCLGAVGAVVLMVWKVLA